MARKGFVVLGAIFALMAGAKTVLAADPESFVQAPVQAPPSFYIHAGLAGVFLDEGAKMKLGGVPVVGGNISVQSQATIVVELGYFITPNIAVSLTGGWPPRADIHPAGTLAGFPKLGVVTYGPMAATIHYHFTNFGRFQPYIGAGPTFLLSLRAQDRLITRAALDHSIGFAVQAGFNYMFTEQWGFVLDVKRAILRSKASGFIGAAPMSARVQLDTSINER